MQTIKGLIALLLVALAVFAVMARNDIKSQDRYAAKLRNAAGTFAAQAGAQTAPAASTNVLRQAQHKTANKNL